MHNHPSEREIIVEACRGNVAAFDHIVQLWERPLFNYLRRFFDRKEDAQDVTQETFLKVYRGLHSYNQAKKFSTWLFTIATHTAYDWLRKKRRFPESLSIDDGQYSSETIEDPRSYNIIEDRIDIDTALKELRPEYRAVLLLYYYQSLTYEEMTEILALPLNTVKTHLRRAKEALKNAFDEARNK